MAYQKKAKSENSSYKKLRDDLKTGELERCYVFHGVEQYLMMNSLEKLRSLLCPGGLDSFNYKRFDISGGSAYTNSEAAEQFAQNLEEATEVLPFTAEKTLIEIHEYNIFKSVNRERIVKILSGLPDYVCVVFVYSTIEFSPDKRLSITKEFMKAVSIIDFAAPEESELITWIERHFKALGKDISGGDARYLAEITGGLMTALHGEIEKVAAFAKEPRVSRGDIDAVVTPVLDAVVYRLSDAIIKREGKLAMQTLDKLFQMREEPHKLMYSISLKMRQLLAARVCLDHKAGKDVFMRMCDIRHDYPAQILLSTAKQTSLPYCRKSVLMCAKTAKELNSGGDNEARIIELVAELLHTEPIAVIER